MTDPRCGQDTAAYVLGALDPEELATFRRHLRACSVCEAEVESFGGAVGELALAVPQYAPPRDLRQRVISEVRTDARRRRRAAASAAVSAPRPAYRPGWMAGAAMATLVLLVVTVSLTLGGERGTFRGPFGPAHRSSARVFSAQVGAAQVVSDGTHGELVVRHLAPLDTARVYEVWLVRGHGGAPQPTSTLFHVSSDGSAAVDVPANMRTVTEVMVTAEPAGGTAVPTTQPVVVAPTS